MDAAAAVDRRTDDEKTVSMAADRKYVTRHIFLLDLSAYAVEKNKMEITHPLLADGLKTTIVICKLTIA